MRKIVIGVMGGCVVDDAAAEASYRLGRGIAENGWALLNGGRPTGAMDASARGAHDAGGLTVGVLYDDDRDNASPYLDIVIPTGMGAGRNIINVLSSDVVVACPGNGGTMSEIAMALRFERRVILMGFDPGAAFLDRCGQGEWSLADTPADAIAQIKEWLDRPKDI